MSAFPHLFRPIDLGSIRLANRIVMGSMHTRLETLDRPLERIARFYVERAKGGAALIITGGFSPNAEGLMEPGAPLFDSREQLARASADHASRARGRRQDRAADPACGALRQDRRRGRAVDHRLADQPECAAAHDARPTSCAPSRTTPRRRRWPARPATTASRSWAREGYLINEFTAPRTNDRTDDWGGSLENRLRLAVEIMAARARAGRAAISSSSSASPRSTWSRAA